MSTCVMVLHRTAPHPTWTLRSLGYAAAYALAMVMGTALLMAVLAGAPDGRVIGPDGQRITAAESTMQAAAERALVSGKAAVLAATTNSNDKRGM
jgi:hypothetical protein